MESTKKTSKKSSSKAKTGKIQDVYKKVLLTEGKQPPSVYKFCLDMGINESDFYAQFGSLDAVEAKIWKDMIETTIHTLESDAAFKDFTAQEKILTFYYSLFEELLHNRSYVLLQLKNYQRVEVIPSYLRDFKKLFDTFFEKTLEEGKVKSEIARRPYLDKRYPQMFWFHFAFILLFWKDDNSAGFEKTDAAIEKSVTLAFDLIGKGAFDSAIDFAKFIYQSRMGSL